MNLAEAIETQTRDAVDRGRGNVTLDLSQVAELDSVVLARLVAAHRTMAEREGRLSMRGVSPAVRDRLVALGLAGRLDLCG